MIYVLTNSVNFYMEAHQSKKCAETAKKKFLAKSKKEWNKWNSDLLERYMTKIPGITIDDVNKSNPFHIWCNWEITELELLN